MLFTRVEFYRQGGKQAAKTEWVGWKAPRGKVALICGFQSTRDKGLSARACWWRSVACDVVQIRSGMSHYLEAAGILGACAILTGFLVAVAGVLVMLLPRREARVSLCCDGIGAFDAARCHWKFGF